MVKSNDVNQSHSNKKGMLTLVLHLSFSKRRSKIMITVIDFTAYVQNKHLMTLFGQ